MKDIIVDEVRQAGIKIANECDNDIHKFAERMRKIGEQYKDRLKSPVIKKKYVPVNMSISAV